MFNPKLIFEIQNMWNRFTANHPKFPMFLQAVSGIKLNEGTIIEMQITTAEGKNISTNVKLNQDDVEMFRQLSEMMRDAR